MDFPLPKNECAREKFHFPSSHLYAVSRKCAEYSGQRGLFHELLGENMDHYLYRGFGIQVYDSVTRALTPKAPGQRTYLFSYNENIKYDDSATYGQSEPNFVLRHQLNQEGYSTAGISTTPHRERAIFYALGGGKHSKGIILTIDRNLLTQHGVTEYIVSKTVKDPAVPEDNEVILVAQNGGPLPLEIVIAKEYVCNLGVRLQ